MTRVTTYRYIGTTGSSDTVYRRKMQNSISVIAGPAIIVTGFFRTQRKVRTSFPFWSGNYLLSLVLQLCWPITVGQVIQNDSGRR